MKKIYLLLVVTFISFTVNSQTNASVEKSIFGIQTGFLGVWVHNETKLTNSIALRSEIGLDSGIFGGDYYNNTNFILFPTFSLEPRLYYNLNKRLDKDKTIVKNSGNFVSIKLNYSPDLFVISSLDNASVVENASIIPKWGIKRSIGNHFTYEAGIGLGYRLYFLKKQGADSNSSEAAIDLHLRIGYTF